MQRNFKFVAQIAMVWLVVVSTTTPVTFAQQDSPKWKLNQGDQFSVALNQTSKSLTKVDAREITVDNSTMIELDWSVANVDDQGVATIEQVLTRVKLSVNGFARVKKGERATPLKDIGFDTAAADDVTKDSKTLLKQIQPLLGLKFTVMMDPNGKINDVTISKEVTEQLNQMPEAQNLKRLFSSEGLTELIGASAIVFPGDLDKTRTWTEKSNVDSPLLGQLNRVRTYQYMGDKDVDGKSIGQFDLTVDLTSAPSEDAADSLKGKLLEFSGSGELFMDLDGGYLTSSKVQNKTVSEKPYREKMITTTISNEIEMTVEKK